MLCRLQCARFAIRWRIAGALPSSPTRLTLRVTIAIPSVRHFVISHGAPAGKISDFSRGARGAALKRASPCERLVSGSTPNEITSCLRTSRSCCSLFRLRKRYIIFKDALNKGASYIRVPQSRRKAPERIVLGRFRAAFRRLYSNFSTRCRLPRKVCRRIRRDRDICRLRA